jgi:hypothetical protein
MRHANSIPILTAAAGVLVDSMMNIAMGWSPVRSCAVLAVAFAVGHGMGRHYSRRAGMSGRYDLAGLAVFFAVSPLLPLFLVVPQFTGGATLLFGAALVFLEIKGRLHQRVLVCGLGLAVVGPASFWIGRSFFSGALILLAVFALILIGMRTFRQEAKVSRLGAVKSSDSAL